MPVELTGRHYTGAPSGTEAWSCPACGAEVTDRKFGHPDGCPSCGAGKAGRHVEPAGPIMHAYMVEQAARGVEHIEWDPEARRSPADVAFQHWLTAEFALQGPTLHRYPPELLFRAFSAGAMWMQTHAESPVPPAQPASVGEVVMLPRLVAESILATLVETVDLADGQQSTALQGLIAALRETLE